MGRKNLFISDAGIGADVASNKSCFEAHDLLFGKLRPYFHKVALAPSNGICSTDILVFKARANYLHSFMTLTANTEEFVEYANLRSTGTRMPRASAKDILGYLVAIPDPNILEVFEKTVSVYWDKGYWGVRQNLQLTKLRDTLLPKLISGEIKQIEITEEKLP